MTLSRPTAQAFLSVLLLFSNAAFSEDIVFELASVQGYGNTKLCNESNVSAIASGDDLALVYFDVGIEQTASSRATWINVCRTRGWLTVPQGYYVAKIHSTFAYGIVKPAHVSALLYSTFRFLNGVFPNDSVTVSKQYSKTTEVEQPLEVLSNSRRTTRTFRVRQCRMTSQAPWRMPVVVDTALWAQVHRTTSGSVVMGLDTSDYSFDLAGVVQPCSSLR